MQIYGHLRCHYAEINAQRITIRLRFISAKFLASAPPICKRRFRTVMEAATEHPQRIRTDTDVRGVSQQRV